MLVSRLKKTATLKQFKTRFPSCSPRNGRVIAPVTRSRFKFDWASLVAQTIKCLPTMRETWVRSLVWEDPLEKEMATHSSINAWKIPYKKAKWLPGEALQIAVKRREAKDKGEKERYTHLNAEFQRIARRDKKAFLSNQCKEIEENNRMGKIREWSEAQQGY